MRGCLLTKRKRVAIVERACLFYGNECFRRSQASWGAHGLFPRDYLPLESDDRSFYEQAVAQSFWGWADQEEWNMTSHLSEHDVSFVRIWRLICQNMTSHLSEYDVSFVGIWRLIFQSFVSYEGNCRLNSGGQAPSKGYALLIRKRNLNTKKPLVDLNKGQ